MGLMRSPERRPFAAQALLQAVPWTPVTALRPLPVSVGSGATPPDTASAAAGAQITKAVRFMAWRKSDMSGNMMCFGYCLVYNYM